ncbi:glycine cleavage system protein H [Kocuria flava]|uniref:Glycine cleavage system H protein n=1 Tax=Kocuria flava TaxID=446860 RepID=A0A0U3HU94_9MICC|nr:MULTISPECIES: glycine cleavage system protein GcvH [Kocuria]ALU38455.1 glycine cleavage system protein H [Kocuria flava]MCD1145473.1 glycine cleavage system protein GcvH [Kocuria sp. LUK]MCJ8504175.1 glycine cleavage system protein GcvH [Kocuria flava]PLC12014.1 glycine cleavage system protein H [Kocuria flava]GEO92864.1 glycine cleavage system H protein [Kocuria flava]
MSTVLPDLRYSAEHEWIDSASPARIGISQVAVDALGDVVYLDLPEAGSTVTAGEVCGEVESTKSVSELFSPVTGTVVEVNAEAVDNPAVLNEDPYGAGWLFTVEVSEEGPLLSAQEYADANGGELG